MVRWQRVTLVPLDAEGDAAEARQIILDLTVDDETNISTGPYPAFGRVGDFHRPGTLYPFTLMGDGRMDFGAHASDAQRQAKLHIRAARLVQDETIACDDAGVATQYRINTIAALIP
ncbi:hypothetical protein U1769_15520 [Sphingomonas sp. ZT3P38]|uniref:hypothetical protein n=1 Tax=Parasphingomonas zepuensis TaxID=3096161 RepID=UPI002FCB5B36